MAISVHLFTNRTMSQKVEQSFLWNERDVGISPRIKKGTRRCLHRDRESFITQSLHLCLDSQIIRDLLPNTVEIPALTNKITEHKI